MTDDLINRLADEARCERVGGSLVYASTQDLRRFAALVAEACCQVIDDDFGASSPDTLIERICAKFKQPNNG